MGQADRGRNGVRSLVVQVAHPSQVQLRERTQKERAIGDSSDPECGISIQVLALLPPY